MPIIGIIKQEYDDSDVYITPTMAEVDALVEVGCEIIAIDATNRLRPNGITLESFFKEVRKKYQISFLWRIQVHLMRAKRQRNLALI